MHARGVRRDLALPSQPDLAQLHPSQPDDVHGHARNHVFEANEHACDSVSRGAEHGIASSFALTEGEKPIRHRGLTCTVHLNNLKLSHLLIERPDGSIFGL